LQNEKKITLVQAITRACAITSKTVHHIMEDNFALRYVLKHTGVNSRAELVPSPRAYARNSGLVDSGIIETGEYFTWTLAAWTLFNKVVKTNFCTKMSQNTLTAWKEWAVPFLRLLFQRPKYNFGIIMNNAGYLGDIKYLCVLLWNSRRTFCSWWCNRHYPHWHTPFKFILQLSCGFLTNFVLTL
jgi:hypothetical protein